MAMVGGDVGGALGDLVAALGSVSDQGERTGQAGQGEPGPVEGLRGVGTAASGRVRAEVSVGGRLEALTIDPGLLRAGLTSVADVVVEAVRAAQDDVAGQAAAVQAEAVPSAVQLAAAQAAEAGTARLGTMLAELTRIGDWLGGSAGGPTSGSVGGSAR